VLTGSETEGERIRIEGRIFDGTGSPVRDMLVEIWQANAAGRYNHPADRQEGKPLDPSFRGWGRTGTDFETGLYMFETIKPGRVSDGLFDLMDLFNTSLALGGIENKIPTERYIDGVNQTAFLLADDGDTCRQAVFSYNQADFSAIRWANFKGYFKVVQSEQPFANISMSTYGPIAVAPWIFDIYRDPKERLTRSNGDYEWLYGPVLQLQAAHAATFIKYPKKDIGLGVGGDPR